MPDGLVMCRCGNKAKYYADNTGVCGTCLFNDLSRKVKDRIKADLASNGVAVVMSVEVRILVKGCPTDRSCSYWLRGECIVHTCVKGD